MAGTVRKIPIRKCTGCGEMKPKKELLRILLQPDGSITVDDSGKKNGRGAYICRSLGCLEKAVKQKGLEKSLKVKIPDDIYSKLKEEYEWPNE